jgi:dipeptidyl aminopeptidase/acylaminoacyl peptidase
MVLQMGWNGASTDSLTVREASDAVRGYRSAVERLDALGYIDPKRVGAIGWSRTCWHVESALIEDPKLLAAASITDGVDESYMQHMLDDVDYPANQQEGVTLYGGPAFGKSLATWVRDAAGFHLDRVQAPLLIGAVEGPSSVMDEWEIYASLRMQNKPVDMIYISDGQHILQKPLDRMASQQGNVDWFRFWLQGYEDPDPAKAAQYVRWRSLRELQQGATKR